MTCPVTDECMPYQAHSSRICASMIDTRGRMMHAIERSKQHGHDVLCVLSRSVQAIYRCHVLFACGGMMGDGDQRWTMILYNIHA